MTRAMRSTVCEFEEVTVVARAQVNRERQRRALRFGGVSSVPPADEAQNPRCRLRKRMRCIVWWAVRATFTVVIIKKNGRAAGSTAGLHIFPSVANDEA